MDIKLIYVLLTPGTTFQFSSIQCIELKVTPTVRLVDVKNLICEIHAFQLECQSIGRDDIKIFAPVDVKIQPFTDLPERLQHKLASLQPHILTDFIQSIFGEQQPEVKSVHLVALCIPPVLEERGRVHELSAVKGKAVLEERMRFIDAAAADISPSTAVSTPENIKAAYNVVHAGRPALNYGPPTSIFSPQLARLSDRLQQLDSVEPDAWYLESSHQYIVLATNFYEEETDRETSLRTIIDDVLGAEGQWKV